MQRLNSLIKQIAIILKYTDFGDDFCTHIFAWPNNPLIHNVWRVGGHVIFLLRTTLASCSACKHLVKIANKWNLRSKLLNHLKDTIYRIKRCHWAIYQSVCLWALSEHFCTKTKGWVCSGWLWRLRWSTLLVSTGCSGVSLIVQYVLPAKWGNNSRANLFVPVNDLSIGGM